MQTEAICINDDVHERVAKKRCFPKKLSAVFFLVGLRMNSQGTFRTTYGLQLTGGQSIMISLLKPVSKHQISKRRCMYSFTEKRCIVPWVSHFLSKKKGYILHHKIEQLCNRKYLRKITFCDNISSILASLCSTYRAFLDNCKMPLCKSGNILQSSVEKNLFFLILVCIIQQRRCVKILSFWR